MWANPSACSVGKKVAHAARIGIHGLKSHGAVRQIIQICQQSHGFQKLGHQKMVFGAVRQVSKNIFVKVELLSEGLIFGATVPVQSIIRVLTLLTKKGFGFVKFALLTTGQKGTSLNGETRNRARGSSL